MFDIKDMAKNAIGDLAGDLPIDKLFSSDFIKENSSFSSIQELITKFNPDFKVEDIMSLAGDTDFEGFLGKFTKFRSFADMLTKAKEFLG